MGFTDLFKQAKRVLGGIYQAVDPVLVDGQPTALRTDDKANLRVTVAASVASQEVDIKKVNGTAVVEGGLAGLLGVGINYINSAVMAAAGLAGVLPTAGTGPDGAVPTASYPSRFAGIVRKILTPLTDTHQQTILVDGDGAVWGRSKAHDPISSSDRGSVNTAADVHDQDGGSPVQANESNTAASTVSYPSANGLDVGDFTGFDHEIVATDCTFVFLHCLNSGWVPITSCVQNNEYSGMSGFSVFATGVGASKTFNLTTAGHKGGRIRIDVTYPDAGNAFAWRAHGRYGA